MTGIHTGTIPTRRSSSRNGDVLAVTEPVLLTYERPTERVLFNPERDCNPFLHLYEALWTLAGRNDVAPLAYYNSRMKDYSDDGKTFNGAYGFRWRHTSASEENGTVKVGDGPWEINQLDPLVAHLKADPGSRRAVLTMWNVENDLLKVGHTTGPPYPCCEAVRRVERAPGDATTLLGGACPVHGDTYHDNGSKDVCCNLNVLLALRETYCDGPHQAGRCPHCVRALDVTVTNRSNDLTWGLLGTNYVTFSFLQEYLAARLGAEVGRYHHFTNNLHCYLERWEPVRWLSVDPWSDDAPTGLDDDADYPGRTVPLVHDPEVFERELPEFVEFFSGRLSGGDQQRIWQEPFLETVAKPLLTAYFFRKQGLGRWAPEIAGRIAADDWRLAATNWLERRAHRVGKR